MGANWTVTHDNQGQTGHHRWQQHVRHLMQLLHRSAGAGGAVSHDVTKLNHHSTTTEGTIQNTQKDLLPTVEPCWPG